MSLLKSGTVSEVKDASSKDAGVGASRRRTSQRPDLLWQLALPTIVVIGFLAIWHLAVVLFKSQIFPTPFQVAQGLIELIQQGLLLRYVVASLFRVTWGFCLAVAVGVPVGLMLGWYRQAQLAFNPLIQALRPISPIAWIPVAILWFGVSDAARSF